MAWPCYCFVNALMCIKKVKLINNDCLPMLMLLYITLAYLMLFATLSNAVCMHSAYLNEKNCKV